MKYFRKSLVLKVRRAMQEIYISHVGFLILFDRLYKSDLLSGMKKKISAFEAVTRQLIMFSFQEICNISFIRG